MSKQPQIAISLLQIGNSNVGKTALAQKFVYNFFKANLLNTIGIDYVTKNVTINGKNILVKIWDTAGQERFQQISYQFIRKAEGIAFVYDISNRTSFDSLKKSIEDVLQLKDNISYMIVGNKADLNDEERVVSEWEGQQLANEYHVPFYETSALNGQNVNKSFKFLINLVVNKESEIKNEILSSKSKIKDKPFNLSSTKSSYFSIRTTFDVNNNEINQNYGKCLKCSC